MNRPGCKARQYGDELHCSRCGLVWDIHDPEPPDCLPERCRKHKSQEVGRVALDNMRKMLRSSENNK